jgi:hypothetical protein
MESSGWRVKGWRGAHSGGVWLHCSGEQLPWRESEREGKEWPATKLTTARSFCVSQSTKEGGRVAVRGWPELDEGGDAI